MTLPSYLMCHQREGVLLGLHERRHLYANDTGTGKTVIGIELHRAIRKKTLVVCPLSIIETAWLEDIARFSPDVRAVNLWRVWKKGTKKDDKKKRFVQAIIDNDICIINFESFSKFRVLFESCGFEVLMIDESSRVKNPQAQVTKALTKFADTVEYCYLFSGTPAPNSQLEYFTQVRMVSDVFTRSFYRFRGLFFYPSGYGGYTWKLRMDREKDFKERLATCSSAVVKEDVLDLPERVDMRREITLSSKEMTAYNSMLRHLYLQIDREEITAANAAVKLSKLRQISSGFIIGDNKDISELGTSKLSELKYLLDEIGPKPVVIWTQFQHEAKTIVEELERLGKTVGRVDGTVSQRTKEDYISGFKNGTIRYLVAHPRSMGHGQTLINCTDMVYYSLSYSLEDYLQSRDRIYRYGQKNTCSYYYLIAQGTVEEAVMKAVARKHDIAQDVIDYIKNYGGSYGRQNVQRAVA